MNINEVGIVEAGKQVAECISLVLAIQPRHI
jgi:hypothetical protein